MRIGPIVLAASALVACGGRATSPGPDGGSGDADAGDVGVAVTKSFTVTATLSLMPTGGQAAWDAFPKTHTFTMFVDADALRLVAGAYGKGTAIELSRAGAGAFTTKDAVSLPTSFRGPCDPMSVTYDEMSFSIVAGRLTGTGRGKASNFIGDGAWLSDATATFVGVPDVDAPTILLSTETIAPMGGALFASSEPLAESVASLIGAEGDVFVLGAEVTSGPPPFTTGFVRSSLMLSWGTTYEVTTEALIDLAGNMGARASRPKVATPPAPPLAAEDGFESVQSDTFGGAGVLSAGPFASSKSLVVVRGNVVFPNAGPSLSLRLPVTAGDTVVRFSARLFSNFEVATTTFEGEVRVGVPGREVNIAKLPPANDFVSVLSPNDGPIYLSRPMTIEVPLPLGSSREVSVQVATDRGSCAPPVPPIGVIIDDLRVE